MHPVDLTPVRAGSPFLDPSARRLAPGKFEDPAFTATGAPRARVALKKLETLWFNTGTLCNLACANCYIESTPRNDALVYLSASEVARHLNEVRLLGLQTRQIGFTGGEPFLNRELPVMLDIALEGGYTVLVLTNAMRPMRRAEAELLALLARHGSRLKLRVSLDHHTAAVHEAERGPGTWNSALSGLVWLVCQGFSVAVAGRHLAGESDAAARQGYAALFTDLGLQLDVTDPEQLVLFPEMDAGADVPEVTEACWDRVGTSPDSLMCATSRMVVLRRGDEQTSVMACTLVPYDLGFSFGSTLSNALGSIALNHPNCARFCVLGRATCS
jgi:uncharacterized Fe-S cluster-containing radical SAM superfamily protein